ncbi:RDD family protein [Virgibacillus sp. 179-BFC.A HS]|uniref:RDD family protein n=1 Tax=Tigheibacillus jepli TaxID=3035914 RepID=A0ABU5CEX9_9BACI|nr:RDD family protein [Virgibacillus sp. 179-BFC.A HS]MDY0404884.1 RDD family protein [Virgibacillus sp. 179-BFC.A HS]
MKTITKKRVKAYLIDVAITTAVTAGLEYFLRKKVKSEVFHTIVTPTAVMATLEYTQMRRNAQTFGYKKMGIKLDNIDGSALHSKQIIKRMIYRETISTFKYLGNPKAFAKEEGAVFPHDSYAETIVKEV